MSRILGMGLVLRVEWIISSRGKPMPKTSSVVRILTLAIVAAAGCRPVAATDPPPKLADLLAEFKGLGLPLPPVEAPLVRYVSGGGAVNGSVQPTTYSLAF